MFLKKRKLRSRTKKNRYRLLIHRIGISSLFLCVLGFIISGVDRIFFDEGLVTESPDLGALITQSSYEKRTGHKIQVEIWNGCGIPKLARMYTDFLRAEGIDVLDSKNADNFNYTETKILHHRGDKEIALALAEIMMIDKINIIEEKNENLFYDLTLIIGNDYLDLSSYRNALMYQSHF